MRTGSKFANKKLSGIPMHKNVKRRLFLCSDEILGE